MHLPVLLQIAEIWCATSKNPRLRDPFLLQFPQPQKIIRSCLPWRESSLLPAVLIVFRLSEAEDNSIESESIDWTKSGAWAPSLPFCCDVQQKGQVHISQWECEVWLVCFSHTGSVYSAREPNVKPWKPKATAFRTVRMPQQISLPFNVLCSLCLSLWYSPGKSGKWSKHPQLLPCIVHNTPVIIKPTKHKRKLQPKYLTVYISSNQSLEGALNDLTVTFGISTLANFALNQCWIIFRLTARPCVEWSHLRKPRW
jgi:hypothetical protein